MSVPSDAVWVASFRWADSFNFNRIDAYYFATGRGFTALPSTPMSLNAYDLAPNEVVQPRIKQLPHLQFARVAAPDGGGDGVVPVTAEIVLENADHYLDALFVAGNVFLQGQQFDLWYVPASYDGAGRKSYDWTQRVSVLQMVIDDFEMGDTVTVKLRASSSTLDANLLTQTYGGTGGIDGTASLAGQYQPLAIGYCDNVRPRLLDPVTLLYQYSGTVPTRGGLTLTAQITAVYDNGVALTQGPDYPDLATLLSTAPAAGQWRQLPASGLANQGAYFRLGSTPAGDVTCDGYGGPYASYGTSYDTARGILRIATASTVTLATDARFVGGGTVDPTTASQTAHGLYYDGTQPVTVREAVSRIFASLGAWCQRMQPGGGPAGGENYMVRLLDSPGSIPDASSNWTVPVGLTFQGAQVQHLQPLQSKDPALTTAVWQVTLLHSRLFAVQSTGLATSLTPDRRDRLARETLPYTVSDAPTRTIVPNARTLTLDTTYVPHPSLTTMQATAARLLALLKLGRRVFEVGLIGVNVDELARAIIGDKVTIQKYAFWGCGLSRDFLLLSADLDMQTGSATLLVWG